MFFEQLYSPQLCVLAELLITLHWEAQLNCIRSQTNPEFLLFKETNLCVNFKMSQAKFLARETSLYAEAIL